MNVPKNKSVPGEALRQSMKNNMHNLPEQIYGSF